MEFTINLTYVFGLLYAAFKGFAAVWISKHEFQYPIWNQSGVQIERGLHHKLQSVFRNFFINPEWGLLKIIAFGPVFLFTGKKYMHYFMPWKVTRSPIMCKQCGDKGRYFAPSFVKGGKGDWNTCDCQSEVTWAASGDVPDCTCHVCLDKGTIGPNRVCPHCDHRRKLASVVAACEAEGKSDAQSNPTHIVQEKLDGARTIVAPPILRHAACHEAQTENPYSYLSCHEKDFCGDIYGARIGNDDRSTSHWMRKIQPTEVQVGDTIIIRSMPKNHCSKYYMDRSLRVLGVCLPFMVVECDTQGAGTRVSRHVDSIDVRGMALMAHRKATENNGCNNKYHPMLSPMKLKVGDRFVMSRLSDMHGDSSYRGQAFEVIEAMAKDKGRDATIKVRHLSWGGTNAIRLRCEGLQIISCDDRYVAASKKHCPDISVKELG